MRPDALRMAAHFAHTRWRLNFRNRAQLEAWQQRQLRYFMSEVLPLAPRYRDMKAADLSTLPIMDKALMMEDFAASNTRGVELREALEVGLSAEVSRDFSPTLGDLTVGLSSGTSGNRGVFLVSEAERLRWAGILLARAVPQHLFARLLTPWRPPLRIAFFLRANSNLYTTLSSRRIDFSFYDLLVGVEAALSRLDSSQPDVLVGPPSLLRALAAEVCAGRLHIRPSHVISVAEVLEDRDVDAICTAFGRKPHQLYQATEGFLAYTCEAGTLHLNESFIHIEPDWLDNTHTRFQPIITDFSRCTQLIVRYRLNDVLRLAEQPCSCGRAERAIAAIEGRADEVMWLPSLATGLAVPIFPDQMRRAMLFAGPEISEYDLTQLGMHLNIGLLSNGKWQDAVNCVTNELDKLWASLGVQAPTLFFSKWQSPQLGAKRRRVHLDHLPRGLACTF